MAKINAARYGGMRGTPLAPEHLEGDSAVFTVSEFGEQANTGQGRKISPVLRYKECPEYLHYLNREQVERIVAKLGDESDAWIGKQIPVWLEDIEGPVQGGVGTQMYRKVYVMPPDKWAATFEAEKKRTAPKAAKK